MSRKVLLDENVNVRVKALLEGLDVSTVYDLGIDRLVNGELLTYARENVQVLITHDRGIPHQHNHKAQSLIIIVLATKTTELVYVSPLIEKLKELIGESSPGSIAILSQDNSVAYHTP